jgi:hypothetical protein
MILGAYGKMLIAGVYWRAFRNRPGHHPVDHQPKIVLQPPAVVLLNDEQARQGFPPCSIQ